MHVSYQVVTCLLYPANASYQPHQPLASQIHLICNLLHNFVLHASRPALPFCWLNFLPSCCVHGRSTSTMQRCTPLHSAAMSRPGFFHPVHTISEGAPASTTHNTTTTTTTHRAKRNPFYHPILLWPTNSRRCYRDSVPSLTNSVSSSNSLCSLLPHQNSLHQHKENAARAFSSQTSQQLDAQSHLTHYYTFSLLCSPATFLPPLPLFSSAQPCATGLIHGTSKYR